MSVETLPDNTSMDTQNTHHQVTESGSDSDELPELGVVMTPSRRQALINHRATQAEPRVSGHTELEANVCVMCPWGLIPS